MAQIDRNVLTGVGLGLNSPEWDLPAGIGLRWALPVSSTVHGDGLDFTVHPSRGWPDNGYDIYRAGRGDIETLCANLTGFQRPQNGWRGPVNDSQAHLKVVWTEAPEAPGNLAEQLAAARVFAVFFDPTALAVTLEVGTALNTAAPVIQNSIIRVTGYDLTGHAVSQVEKVVTGETEVKIEGPYLSQITVELQKAQVNRVCASRSRGDWGVFLTTVKPITDPAVIRDIVPPSRRGEDWERFASLLSAALADPDASLDDPGEIEGIDEPLEGVSGMRLIDLFMLLSLDPVIARILGLLWWDESAQAREHYIYTIVGAWREIEFTWTLPPLTREPPTPFALRADLGFTAKELPPVIQVNDDGVESPLATAAGLTWRTAADLPFTPPRPVDAPARYRVSRATVDFGKSLSEVEEILANEASYTPINGEFVVPARGLSGRPDFWARDSGFEEGYQGWSLKGYDLFGRPSRFAFASPLTIRDLMPPPAPFGVRAAFLDAAALPSSPAEPLKDPLLTPEHVAWMKGHPSVPTALYIGFDWPPEAHRLARTVREFRLYAQAANAVPRVKGTITSVEPAPEAEHQSDVVLSASLPPNRNAFVGGTLSDGRASFIVTEVAAASYPTPRVRVRHLSAPQKFTTKPNSLFPDGEELIADTSASDEIVPTSGQPFMLVLNLRPPVAWPERLAIIPRIAPINTTIESVLSDIIINDARLVKLWLASAVAHPNAVAGVYLEGGYLTRDKRIFTVLRLETLDADRTLPLDHTEITLSLAVDDTTTFPAGEAVTYFTGYAVYLPHARFRATSEARAYGLVTVTSANNSQAPNAVDDPVHGSNPKWQEDGMPRRGFESAAAPPATVIDILRATPKAPPRPESELLASWPDAAGQATFTLSWEPAAGVRYVVYRALDESVFAFDRRLRASQGTNYGSDEIGETPNLLEFTSPTQYPDPAHPGAPDYHALPDAGLLRRIASLPGNARAFAPLMAKPLGKADLNERLITTVEGEKVVTAPGMWLDTRTGWLYYTDTLPGIGVNQYFYCVLAIDEAANRSPLGPSTLPVALRVKKAPRTPVLDRIRAGDLALTVLWNHPDDGSVDRYLVYRANNPSAFASLGLFTPDVVDRPRIFLFDSVSGTEHSGLPDDREIDLPPGATTSTDLRWGWLGSELDPVETWFVVVAEKEIPGGASLRSLPSEPIRGRPLDLTPPEPPEITKLERRGSIAHLEYEVGHPWIAVQVEVKQGADRFWRSVSTWKAASNGTTVEFPVEAGVAYSIRLHARNADGIVSGPSFGRLN